jgi:hypothetical protein
MPHRKQERRVIIICALITAAMAAFFVRYATAGILAPCTNFTIDYDGTIGGDCPPGTAEALKWDTKNRRVIVVIRDPVGPWILKEGLE